MGSHFSFLQRTDEWIAALLSFDSLPAEDDHEEEYVFPDEIIPVQDDNIQTMPSGNTQAEPPPSPPLASDLETLAREERRRKRDERRAARRQSEEKFNFDLNFKSSGEYLEDKAKLDVHTYHPCDPYKKCLVLDIDYTIFDHKSDFDMAMEFKRPYLHEFLKTCSAYYNIVIWSATAFTHIQTKMEKLQLFNNPDFKICHVFNRDHMIPYAFSIKRKTYVQDIKPLSLLWMKYPTLFTPFNTIHVDDVEENFVLNPRNGLRIEPFKDAMLCRHMDRELFYLAQYLSMISDLPSFAVLDHCRWKDYVINELFSMQTILALPTFVSPSPPSSHLLARHRDSVTMKRVMKEKAREDQDRARERVSAQRERDELLREKQERRERGAIGQGKEQEVEEEVEEAEDESKEIRNWDVILARELNRMVQEGVMIENEIQDRQAVHHHANQFNVPASPSLSLKNDPKDSNLSPNGKPKLTPTKAANPKASTSPTPSTSPSPSPSLSLSPRMPTPKLSSNPKMSPHLTPLLTSPSMAAAPSPQDKDRRKHGRENRRSEWVVKEMKLLDLIQHQTSDMVLFPHNNPVLHAAN